MGFEFGTGGSGGVSGGISGGGSPVSVTKKILDFSQIEDIGVAVDVNITNPDLFFDTTIDMPATADIDDSDLFIFSAQFRALTTRPRHELISIAGKDWKVMEALTDEEERQSAFTTASSRKTATFFLRRTSGAGGQLQQNFFLAKGADGVSLYAGDNHSAFDANLRVWRLGSVTETVVDGVTGGGGNSGSADSLPSLSDSPDGIENDSLWNRNGLFVQEHVKHLDGSARAYTTYDISTPFVNVNGKLIANINRPALWYGLFLEDEHATDGVRRPTAAGSLNRFGLNVRNGNFEKSNGTDWLVYDPFATGEPWDNVYPYGAYVDTTFQSGVNQGSGIRVAFTGTLPSIIGTNGDDWELYWYFDSAISASNGIVVELSTGTANTLNIGLKAIDGGADAPTLVSIVQAINSYQPAGANSGFLITASYVGVVTAGLKVSGAWGSDSFQGDEEITVQFGNGSPGTTGVDLTRLNHWAETKAELDESWSEVGQVGLDFAGADLHALAIYTPPEDEHIEETTEIYKAPGFKQVIGLGVDSKRPAPGNETLGKLYLDHYRGTATFDLEDPIASSNASGTSGEYTHADFEGVGQHSPTVTAANKLFYNTLYHSWEFSAAAFIGTGYRWATVDFSDIGTLTPDIGGLPADKHWLGEKADLNAAVNSVRNYSLTTTYYFLNISSGNIESLTSYTAPVQQHIEYSTLALGVNSPYNNNPTLILWGNGQSARVEDEADDPANHIRISANGGNALLKWKLDSSEILFGAQSNMAQILTATQAGTDAADADNLPPVGSRGDIYMKFTPGYWSFNGFVFAQESGALAYSRCEVLRVASATDIIIGTGNRTPFGSDPDGVGTPDLSNAVDITAPLINVSADDVYYFLYGDGVAATAKVSQYMKCTYHGLGG